jgi:hypothetical protein
MLASARICCEFKSNHIPDVSGVVGKKTRPSRKNLRSRRRYRRGSRFRSGLPPANIQQVAENHGCSGEVHRHNGGMKFRGAGEDLPYTLIPFDQLSSEQRAASPSKKAARRRGAGPLHLKRVPSARRSPTRPASSSAPASIPCGTSGGKELPSTPAPVCATR